MKTDNIACCDNCDKSIFEFRADKFTVLIHSKHLLEAFHEFSIMFGEYLLTEVSSVKQL